MNRESISVTALNRYVKSLLESDEVLSQIWVEGEISGFKLHSASGHMYFRLIDKHCSVKCVMFYSYASKLKFMPQDGMKVLVCCDVSLYEVTGDFQLYVKNIVEKGAGERKTKLDLLKEKLQSQGLFAAERKRPIPPSPRTVAVITSSSGAALQDIINVISRRDPFVELWLYPVNVQGAFAVDSICRSITLINSSDPFPDTVIIARGGGSKDDLWVFNEEKLVVAASSLKVPFISAVGHETDFSLLDFAADLRVPTPSVAAEIAVPDVSALIDSKYQQLYESFLGFVSEIKNKKDSLADKSRGLTTAAERVVYEKEKEVSAKEDICRNLSPIHLLERGYSVAEKEGSVVRSASDFFPGDRFQLMMYDGELKCTVNEVIDKNGL